MDGRNIAYSTCRSNRNSMKQNTKKTTKPNERHFKGRPAIENQHNEIRCFFSLITKHYKDILSEYAKLVDKGPDALEKTSHCAEMIAYCDEGLEHLKSDNGREIICVLNRMIACFSIIMQHTGSSQTEIPNLKELRATRFYTSNLKKQIVRAFEGQES